jgi:hypothetical protein
MKLVTDIGEKTESLAFIRHIDNCEITSFCIAENFNKLQQVKAYTLHWPSIYEGKSESKLP